MLNDCATPHTNNNSWWEYDRKGIPLCRVCESCRKAALQRYNPAVLDDEQCKAIGSRLDRPAYEAVVEEQIEPEQEG